MRKTYAGQLRGLRVSELSDRAYRDLVAECRAAGVPVAFFLTPESPVYRTWYSPDGRAALAAFTRVLADELGCPVFDAPTDYREEDFADGHHMLPPAARRFSRNLAERHVRPWLASARAPRGGNDDRRPPTPRAPLPRAAPRPAGRAAAAPAGRPRRAPVGRGGRLPHPPGAGGRGGDAPADAARPGVRPPPGSRHQAPGGAPGPAAGAGARHVADAERDRPEGDGVPGRARLAAGVQLRPERVVAGPPPAEPPAVPRGRGAAGGGAGRTAPGDAVPPRPRRRHVRRVRPAAERGRPAAAPAVPRRPAPAVPDVGGGPRQLVARAAVGGARQPRAVVAAGPDRRRPAPDGRVWVRPVRAGDGAGRRAAAAAGRRRGGLRGRRRERSRERTVRAGVPRPGRRVPRGRHRGRVLPGARVAGVPQLVHAGVAGEAGRVHADAAGRAGVPGVRGADRLRGRGLRRRAPHAVARGAAVQPDSGRATHRAVGRVGPRAAGGQR